MNDAILIEATLHHVLSVVSMINRERLDVMPCLFAVMFEVGRDEGGIFTDEFLFGLNFVPAGDDPAHVEWAEIRADIELEPRPARDQFDVAEQIARLLLERGKNVLAIFMAATGIFVVEPGDGSPAVPSDAVMVTGQSCDGTSSMAYIPTELTDGILRVTGEIRASIGRGHYHVFKLFWDVYKDDEKSYSAYN